MSGARRRAAPFAVLALALALAPGAACAADSFDIPEGNAAETLATFLTQSPLELIFLPTVVGKYTTRPIRGRFEPLRALELMFAGVPLLALSRGDSASVIDCAAEGASPAAARETNLIATCQAAGKIGARLAKPGPGPQPLPAAAPEEIPSVRVIGNMTRRPAARANDPSLQKILPADVERTFGNSLTEALHALPGVHGSGPTEDTYETGTDAPTNSGRGIGINLRGFGAGATLALVNGHRIAASGTDAAFTDISNLSPLFVEETQLLADAASAVYGSDAVGGVVNFITRRDFDGVRTEARYGSAKGGTLDTWEIGQLFGRSWGSVHAVLGANLRSSDALPASDRPLAKSDLRDLGGDNFDTDRSNPGNVLTQHGTSAIPAAQDGTALSSADLLAGQTNFTNRTSHTDIIAAQKMASAYAALRFEPRPGTSFSLDGYFAHRRARAASGSFAALLPVPFSNPFAKQLATPTTPVFVAYDFYDDLGQMTLRADVRSDFVTAEFESRLARGWYASGYMRRATERQHQSQDNRGSLTAILAALMAEDVADALNPFGDGSHTPSAVLERIRTTGHTFARSRTGSMGVDASGPLLSVLGREPNLAIGVDYRDQSLRSEIRAGGAGEDARFARSRDALAFVMQLDFPIAKRIDLSYSGRYESFLGAGDAFTSRLKAEWQATQSLTLFSNWSQSFRLPPLGQLDETQNGSLIQPLPDPATPGQNANALIEFGKNAALQPETAESWSAGLRIDPPLAGISLRLSYFNVRIRNRIESTAFSDQLLIDLELAHLVNRAPTAAQRAEVCTRTQFHGPLAACEGAPLGALVDLRLRNIAVLESRGIELGGTWKFASLGGQATVGVNATYLVDYEEAQTPWTPLIEHVDLQHEPPDFRLLASAQWTRGGFGATVSVNFTDRYHDRESNPDRIVSGWKTCDASLGYRFGNGLSVRLVGQNLFDEAPPFLNNSLGTAYDPENADLKGRRVSMMVRLDR